jgi:hypothetical protein
MSVMFYTFRNGKKSKGFKYEDLDSVWFTETKGEKPTPQITITLKSKPDVTNNSWDHGPNDQKLTEESISKASKEYSEYLIRIESKKRKSVIDLTHDPKIKK